MDDKVINRNIIDNIENINRHSDKEEYIDTLEFFNKNRGNGVWYYKILNKFQNIENVKKEILYKYNFYFNNDWLVKQMISYDVLKEYEKIIEKIYIFDKLIETYQIIEKRDKVVLCVFFTLWKKDYYYLNCEIFLIDSNSFAEYILKKGYKSI